MRVGVARYRCENSWCEDSSVGESWKRCLYLSLHLPRMCFASFIPSERERLVFYSFSPREAKFIQPHSVILARKRISCRTSWIDVYIALLPNDSRLFSYPNVIRYLSSFCSLKVAIYHYSVLLVFMNKTSGDLYWIIPFFTFFPSQQKLDNTLSNHELICVERKLERHVCKYKRRLSVVDKSVFYLSSSSPDLMKIWVSAVIGRFSKLNSVVL